VLSLDAGKISGTAARTVVQNVSLASVAAPVAIVVFDAATNVAAVSEWGTCGDFASVPFFFLSLASIVFLSLASILFLSLALARRPLKICFFALTPLPLAFSRATAESQHVNKISV
jgi:hypothetical protein